MLDAMKSLLGVSVGSYAPQQLQPQADQDGQKQKSRAQEIVANPAVEINLSAQALRIMEAIENGDLTLDDQGKLHRKDAEPTQVISGSGDQSVDELSTDDESSPYEPLDNIIKEVVRNIQSGAFNADQIEEIDRLFSEVLSVLDNQATEAPAQTGSAQPAIQTPVQPTENLTANDQVKAVILYRELNKLLGNVGVFFGRDLSLAKMTASAQENATVVFDELSTTLGRDKVESMRSPEQARVDAIFRQLEQLYSSAENNLPTARTSEITSFFDQKRSANGSQLG